MNNNPPGWLESGLYFAENQLDCITQGDVVPVRESIHGSWSSRWAFILAATGSAVGLGNIWTFPYTVGVNGGGSFVLVYLLCLFLVGIPIMIAEITLGRRARQCPVNTMYNLAIESGHNPMWKYLGIACTLAGFIFLSYYSVISGWAIFYMVLNGVSVFTGATVEGVNNRFLGFTQDPVHLLLFHTLFMLMTMYVVSLGVRSGLEKATKIAVPGVLVILLVLLVYAMDSKGFEKGFAYLFFPDFSKLSWRSVLIAMEHSFFTLSLGMGAMMIYGAYLPGRVPIVGSVVTIAVTDTIFTLITGLIIFPLIFSGGLSASSGPGLLFIDIPLVFGQLGWGRLFGTLFYIMIILTAWTSAIALLEPSVTWLMENHGFKRIKATFIAGAAAWVLGILTVFSFNKLQFKFSLFGKIHQNGFFDVFDQLTTKIMLPVIGILIALFAGWFMSKDASRDELDTNKWVYNTWRFLMRYVSPFAILIVFLKSIGFISL